MKRGNQEYKVLIKGAFKGIREEYWELEEETIKRLDKDGIGYALRVLENGQPHYYFVPKSLWENFEKLAQLGVARLPPGKQLEVLKKLLKH